MTYCLGLLLRDGLVLMADTRTNAGIDNISSYAKLHVLADGEDRLVVALSAGNLSVTQAALALLAEGLPPLVEGDPPRTIALMPSMFRAAQLVGEALTVTLDTLRPNLARAGVDWGVTLLVGGRIGAEPLALNLVYAAGNSIACRPDTPFLQIGDTHYGKPILDRAVRWETPLDEAVKVGLLSFDATLRSNLAVGLPIDIMVVPADKARQPVRHRIAEDDAYFRALSTLWQDLLEQAREAIPDPPFLTG
ncbi:peptidase [Sphingomonas jatrophae]|uniref:Putative proteasome-type protease n=1 Tax=Sphingomonas jatrophae TaxID=1166337 RepID=A0A1I6LGN0_9SPHN|nr:peptidase [Sphingomonas jatrophae]SFS02553.1 putative proteasome-type protease [Sphingomonas jatrophae]